jgi:hypothetical protein
MKRPDPLDGALNLALFGSRGAAEIAEQIVEEASSLRVLRDSA